MTEENMNMNTQVQLVKDNQKLVQNHYKGNGKNKSNNKVKVNVKDDNSNKSYYDSKDHHHNGRNDYDGSYGHNDLNGSWRLE